MSSELFIQEGTLEQYSGETVYRVLTTTPWGSSPSNIDVYVYDITNGMADVSSTVAVGSESVSGDEITFGLHAMTAGHDYLVAITFTVSSNVYFALAKAHCPY